MEEITTRLKQYPELKQFELCDCAFNQDLKMLSELCGMIISNNLNLRFYWAWRRIRPDMSLDILKKMRRAGFAICNFGMESGSGPST